MDPKIPRVIIPLAVEDRLKDDHYWLDVYNKNYSRLLGYLHSRKEPDKLKQAVARYRAYELTNYEWKRTPRKHYGLYNDDWRPSILKVSFVSQEVDMLELLQSELYRYLWQLTSTDDEIRWQNRLNNFLSPQKTSNNLFIRESGNKIVPYENLETTVKHYESREVKLITTNNDFYADTSRIIAGINLCKVICSFAHNYSSFRKKYKFNFTNHMFWDSHTRHLRYDSASFTFTLHSGESSDSDKLDCGLSSIEYYASIILGCIRSMLRDISKNYPEDRVKGIKDRITSLWYSQS